MYNHRIPLQPHQGTNPAVSRPRILAVGLDRPEFAAWVDHLRSTGHDVEWRFDGEDACTAFQANPPDLVLTEWNIPPGDGVALCRWVQRSSDLPPPVILVRRTSRSSARIRGYAAGATDILHYQCNAEELLARIQVALRHRAVVASLAAQAATDGLTGLWNRRHADLRLQEMAAAAERTERAFSCILFDLDGFKAINDQFGHSAGDTVLQEAAHRMRQMIRRADLAFRFGGEEFLILAPDTAGVQAIQLADRIRKHIAAEPIEVSNNDGVVVRIAVTASVGVSTWRKEMPVQEIVPRADAAMYAAKSQGKNRVIAAPTAVPTERRPVHVPGL